MNDKFHIEEELYIKGIQYFAKNYIESSMIFSRNARIAEMNDSQNYYDKSNHQANVIGSILFSLLYLESTINEFYINILDFIDFNTDKKANNKRIINKLWKLDKIINFSILDKYQRALILMECDKFNEGINPFQNIKILISLRNYLVHYKPEWVEIKNNEDHIVQLANLEKQLIGKFDTNKTTKIDNDLFPNKYLSYGCTNWALSNSIQFVNDFYDKLDTKYIYKDIINELRKNYGA